MRSSIRIAILCLSIACLAGMIIFASKRTRSATPDNAFRAAKVSPSTSAPDDSQVIRISAKKFEFTPASITLKKGVPVVLEIKSEDRDHGFSLRAFGVRTVVKAGEVSRVSFTPDKTGEFPFSCSVFCGDGHEDMAGTVIVKE